MKNQTHLDHNVDNFCQKKIAPPVWQSYSGSLKKLLHQHLLG